MPGFRQELDRALQSDGQRVFYPYQRGGGVQLPTGIAVELRNPQFGLATQLRRLIDEARRDCAFAVEPQRRAVRHDLLEMILDHRIYEQRRESGLRGPSTFRRAPSSS